MQTGRRGFLAAGTTSLIALPILARPGLAQSASATRIHGIITALKDGTLDVQTTGGAAVSIAFGPSTPITAVTAASLADIKPGSYVGTAAVPGPNGSLVAVAVQIFPENRRGVGEGHRPFDQRPQGTMTNGTVGSDIADVAGVSGRAITINYAGGAKTILVPPDAPVVTFEAGDRTMLTPGAHVSIAASEAAGGALSAVRITVGKAGVTPPL